MIIVSFLAGEVMGFEVCDCDARLLCPQDAGNELHERRTGSSSF
jgi:hypothetical protein